MSTENELSKYFKDMLYVCTRHESAWGYGTMSLDDFIPAWEDAQVIDSIMDICNVHPPLKLWSIDEVESLPNDTVLVDSEGRVWQTGSDEEVQWVVTVGLEDGFPLEDVVLPATILRGGFDHE